MPVFPRLLALCAVLALPSAEAADVDTGAWLILSTGDTITHDGRATNWRYAFDTQWRHFNRGSGSEQYVLRPALGYALGNGISLWAGYGYFLSDPDGASSRHEHRWWQQVAGTVRRWDRGTLSFRTRLEERILENADDTGWRLRQQLQLLVPLTGSELTLVAAVEPFVILRDTDWGARSGFDQNRSYLGVRMPLGTDASLEAGYMHQYINRSGVEDAVNHLGMLHLRVRF